VDFREILARRRMVRHYTGEPLSDDVLERIVRTVRRAPSGGFSQGQRLLIVTEPARRQRIAASPTRAAGRRRTPISS